MDPVLLTIRLVALQGAVRDGKNLVVRATAATSQDELDLVHEALQQIFESRLYAWIDRVAKPVHAQGSPARVHNGSFISLHSL